MKKKLISQTSISKQTKRSPMAAPVAKEDFDNERTVCAIIAHTVDYISVPIVMELGSLIIKITDVVKKLAQDASKCGVIDPLCWAALGPKVAAAGIEIPLQINKVIANTVGLLQGLQISIVNCSADNLSGLVKEANRILQNVTQCVSRHQPHK